MSSWNDFHVCYPNALSRLNSTTHPDSIIHKAAEGTKASMQWILTIGNWKRLCRIFTKLPNPGKGGDRVAVPTSEEVSV